MKERVKQRRRERAEKTKELPGGGRVNDAYAFTGMHHIWDEHHEPVNRVVFANYDSSLLAYASNDGDISICFCLPKPRVHLRIQAHRQGVTDIAFSTTNEMILSVSLDSTVKIWGVEKGNLIRTLDEPIESTACTFHPYNNNVFFIGNIRGKLRTCNMSTGQTTQQLNVSGAISSLVFEPSGARLFLGDSKGNVYIYSYDHLTAKLTQTTKTSTSSKPITSIQYKAWSNSPNHSPEILVNTQLNSAKLFSVSTSDLLDLRREFPISCTKKIIRSCFCPLISLRDGACFVTGGEDSKIKIFDVMRIDKPCINLLMGHSAPVLDVCWNYEESLLASCDSSGTVIVWKRVKL